jgi:hypothetical protein
MPFLVESDLSFMPFLVANATYSCLRLFIECHFWHSGGIIEKKSITKKLCSLMHNQLLERKKKSTMFLTFSKR